MQINDSLNEMLHAKDELGRMFYHHFLTNYPQVQQHFEGVDMKRQGVLLTTALMVIERNYAHPTPAVELYLKYLGTKHKDRQISEDLYPIWINAIIETMAKFHDGDWDSALEQQWREALSQAVKTMLGGYREHITI